MKIGDLVNYIVDCDISDRPCLILDIDDSHRQRSLKLLAYDGSILEKVWIGHVEVISESG